MIRRVRVDGLVEEALVAKLWNHSIWVADIYDVYRAGHTLLERTDFGIRPVTFQQFRRLFNRHVMLVGEREVPDALVRRVFARLRRTMPKRGRGALRCDLTPTGWSGGAG